MRTVNLVKEALKHKSPSLYRHLIAKGKLNEYAQELAEQISERVVALTMEQRIREGWDKLGPMESAGRMKMASILNRELVLAQMLEFPQDETYPPSPDETTDSGPTT